MKAQRFVLLFGVALASGTAAAAPSSAPPAAAGPADQQQGVARYRKQEREVEGVPQTQLTKPSAPVKVEKKSGPTITLEEFTGQRTEKIQKLTDQQIGQMQRLIRVTEDDDPQKPDFYFRLAELYAEKQRYFFFQQHSLDQKIFDAKSPGEKAALERTQQGYAKDEEQWLLKAVATYIEVSKYKKFDRMDVVLYKLAYLLQTVKKEDQAREFFHRLIKDYPNSRYVPEAYLSFAEYFFNKGEMDAALKFYERVEQFPKSPVYMYAVYKKGWCWINIGDFKKALTIFVDVIRMAKEGNRGDPRQNKALEAVSKKDVVSAYARTPGATSEKAWEFFQRVGGDYAPKMMEQLGELYWTQGMFAESTRVYHKMIELSPQSPRICEWQNKVVRNTLSQGTKRDQVQEVGRLGLAYQRIGKMAGMKRDVLEECRNAFHDTVKELALVWHKEAQKTKNPDTYQLTKYVYKIYLDNFGKEKGSIDMAFYYGEVLWVTESWKDAAEQYTKVVEMDPRGKFVKEAAYAAVLAWKNYLNIDDQGQGTQDKQSQDEKSLKPREIPEYQKRMIAAFDTYIKYVPDAPELVKIKYRKARILYEYNHFAESVPLFQDIVDHHTSDELAIYSANLLLDALNAQGPSKTREVVALVDKFIQNPILMKDPAFQKDMVTIKINVLDMEGRRAEKEGNFKECGVAMLAAAESQPESPKHAERLWNAGSCFQNAHLVGRAILAREELIKAHPKDSLAQQALYRIASGYYLVASYKNAAEYYEQFATKFPGERESVTALNNAYGLRLGLQDYDKATEDLNSFIRFYGERQPAKAADVYFQMSEVYERQGKTDELIRHYNSYIQKWGTKGTPDKVILAHFKLGEIAWKKSCPKEGVNGACIELKRVTATGRQKAIYDINKKIKDKRKKIREVRTQCGPPTHAKITVFDRNRTMVKQAQEHFGAVLRLWNTDAKKIPAERMAYARYAAAGAAFYQAEPGYEDFLRIKFPEGLDFQSASQFDSKRKAEVKKKKSAESTKRFLAYLSDKAKVQLRLTGTTSKGMYDHVVTDFKSPHWTVAAAARIGQIYSNFVDQLYTAEIPKDLKEQDEWGLRPREIYCDKLVDTAEPIETKAVKAYDLCLKAATQESWFNEWSSLCEVELNQMQPSEYPLAAEAKPDPGFTAPLVAPSPVLPDLPLQSTTATVASSQ